MSNKNLVTPVGNVMYAWVKNEEIIHKEDGDTPTGKYSVTVSFTEGESHKLLAEINKAWEEFYEKIQKTSQHHIQGDWPACEAVCTHFRFL